MSKSKGSAPLVNAPSKTGRPSGDGRGNAPSSKGSAPLVNAPSKTGRPSGGGRGNAPSSKGTPAQPAPQSAKK